MSSNIKHQMWQENCIPLQVFAFLVASCYALPMPWMQTQSHQSSLNRLLSSIMFIKLNCSSAKSNILSISTWQSRYKAVAETSPSKVEAAQDRTTMQIRHMSPYYRRAQYIVDTISADIERLHLKLSVRAKSVLAEGTAIIILLHHWRHSKDTAV